jgi:hypothetical protein
MDITYMPMARGFVYLAAVVDWFSRKVLSWRVSITLAVDFCLEAVEAALAQYATTTAGFMRHVCREVIPHGDAIGCPGLDGGPKQVFGSDCAAVWASQPMVPPSAQANTVRSA